LGIWVLQKKSDFRSISVLFWEVLDWVPFTAK
jgi:hypothetical protein